MGKKLIIKGADFSADAIPESMVVWNNEFVSPTQENDYFGVGNTENNFIGPYRSVGFVVDGVKVSLLAKSTLTETQRNLQVGDTLKFAKVSIKSPFSKTIIKEVTLTQNDFNNQFIIVTFDQQQEISSSEFLGIGLSVSSPIPSGNAVLLPCTFGLDSGNGVYTKWTNGAGTLINETYSSGIATFYFDD